MEKESEQNKAIEMFYQRSREHGLKISPQRTIICQELLKAKNHPTADDIYKRVVKRMPNISFDTVNRTLLIFSKIRITNVVERYGQARRYDPNIAIPHHFRCIQCGSITDFHHQKYGNITVPEDINKQCTVMSKKAVREGLCGNCRKAGEL